MANFDTYFNKLLAHEGTVFTNTKADKGGATKYGVTFRTWQTYGYDKDGDGKITVQDVKLLTLEDAKLIAKKQYWDYFEADKIANQSLAEFIVDWSYNSGVGYVNGKLKQLLNIANIQHIKSLQINAVSAADLFEKLKAARLILVQKIVDNNPTQAKFLKGWKIRINSFQFNSSNALAGLLALGMLSLLGYYLFNKPNAFNI